MRSILLDIIPRRFRRRSYLVSGTIFLRALLNFAGLALLIPVLLLILDSESMHTNPWLERLYQAGRFESDRAFALTVCGCIVALIAFKNLLNLFLLRYERRYIYDLYRCMSRRLYIEYHDRGLGFIKNTNSALLSRNVNFVCLAFVTGILVPLASITSESMLLALLFTALLFYNPTVAGLVLLVFIPTVWFYYSAVRKRLHRYGVQENEAQREKARTVVETFRGYADLEINDAFPSMLRRFDRAMDKIVTIQSRNMTVNALPSIFMEVGLAIGMALFVAVSLGTPGDEARVLFGVFAVAGLRLMPSVRNMMSGWSALKYNRYTIDILRDIDLNDEKPEPSAAQPPLPFEREIAVRDLSFRFDDERGDKEVLHGLTLTIRKGEHVGIRGASGAGKTTLFNLLLGFYTPTGGEITIDGEPLTAANRRRWQNAVGYVSQHVFLLDGTLLENIALTYTFASNVGIIVAVVPFFTALLAHFLLKGEGFSRRFFLGFSAAFTGIFLIMANGAFVLELNPAGDILALGAAFVWAAYSILMKKIGVNTSNMIICTRRIFFYGIALMIPALWVLPANMDWRLMAKPVNAINLLYLGLFASALCFLTWNRVVEILGAVKSSVYIYMIPVVTVVASAIILGERLTWISLAGILLTLCGVTISEYRKKTRKSGKKRLS